MYTPLHNVSLSFNYMRYLYQNSFTEASEGKVKVIVKESTVIEDHDLIDP